MSVEQGRIQGVRAVISTCSKCGDDDMTPAAAYQNKKYGKGNRVFNKCQGKNTGNVRCTVCGNMKASK